ncbi:lytic murein transglycosylase [Beijerinckia sp. L45]|uniref:lytic murein transglycosylase n=1 Tax=Beijerinckia sp. L45 TaxID=1641855 RepID=UPI00131BB394|nr:lytic murein transglycosylase [Beijerinckia sp. L45]
MQRLDRRTACFLMAVGCAGLISCGAEPAQAASDASFAGFLQTLWPLAEARGVHRATFDSVIAGLTLDPSLPKTSGGQAEFDKPLQSYFKEAVSAGRIAQGRQAAATYADILRSLESRFGVPGEILLAAWAMESDFGRSRGNRDIVRSLATQAYTRPDRPLFRDEFVEALLLLDQGQVDRTRMTGSWAGAMGDPQFMPSAFRKYAVSASGAAPDIWTSPADILASIANFLKSEGWRPDRPWIKEVVLPQGFAIPTLHASAGAWAGFGVRAASGALPSDGDAALFLPSGATGPAFLLFENYWIIKQYNNSDSYALSFGALAQRIAGAPPLSTAWPQMPVNLSRTDKSFVQARLAAQGLYQGAADGKFGPTSRDAIHAYQKQVGISPADGFATPALVKRLRAD